MEVVEEYDSCGRMRFHPSYHDRNKKKWTHEELEYLCKYVESDGNRSISMALGRTEMTIAAKLTELRKSGMYDHYKYRNKYWGCEE